MESATPRTQDEFFVITFVCVCTVHARICTSCRTHVEIRGQLWALFLSFHGVNSRDQIQVCEASITNSGRTEPMQGLISELTRAQMVVVFPVPGIPTMSV